MAWIGSAIGAVGGLLAANQAADASSGAAGMSADVQRYMYDTTRSDYAPWRDVGVNALNQLASLYGLSPAVSTPIVPQYDESQFQALAESILGPRPDNATGYTGVLQNSLGPTQDQQDWDSRYQQLLQAYGYAPAVNAATQAPTQPTGMDAFIASPQYQFNLQEGINALDRSAAARGRLNSGAQDRAVQRYGAGLASGEFTNYVNQLNNLAGFGQTANQATSTAGRNMANNLSNIYQNAGDTRGSAYLAGANIVNNAANNYSLYNALNSGYGGEDAYYLQSLQR